MEKPILLCANPSASVTNKQMLPAKKNNDPISRINKTIDWLQSHLTAVQVYCNDPDLKFTLTKAYTFYQDAFVIKTERAFENKNFNGPPYFYKIWYKDIPDLFITDDDITSGMRMRPSGSVIIYSMRVAALYTGFCSEKKSKEFWSGLKGGRELDLYLPANKKLAMEIIRQIMTLAASSYHLPELPRGNTKFLKKKCYNKAGKSR